MTKWQLLSGLVESACVRRTWTDSAGVRHYGVLQSVEREDGSGHCFNLTISANNRKETFFVRTID